MVKKGVRINWVLVKMEVCSWEKLLACIKLAAKTPENDITRATSCYMGYLSHVPLRTNKYCSDIQRNQTQSPATWNLNQWTQPDYSQPTKNKQTRMRSSTNCFHRWRTLNKTKKLNQNNNDKEKKHNTKPALLLKIGLFHSPTCRRVGRDPGTILGSLWRILSFVCMVKLTTQLYSLFTATRDLIFLPGIQWGIQCPAPDQDQPLQPI